MMCLQDIIKKVCHCYLKIKHVKMIKAILVTCNKKPGKLKKID